MTKEELELTVFNDNKEIFKRGEDIISVFEIGLMYFFHQKLFQHSKMIKFPDKIPNIAIRRASRLINGRNIGDILSDEKIFFDVFFTYILLNGENYKWGQIIDKNDWYVVKPVLYRPILKLLAKLRPILYENYTKRLDFSLQTNVTFEGYQSILIVSNENNRLLFTIDNYDGHLLSDLDLINFLKQLDISYCFPEQLEGTLVFRYTFHRPDPLSQLDIELYENYQKHIFTDFIIETDNKVFNVHKLVFYSNGGEFFKGL